MMKKPQLVAFGEAIIDFTPTESGTYYPNPGGAPFNLAICAAKYGVSTAFIGKVGTDAFGDLLVGTAEKYGVETCGFVRDERNVTTHAFLTIGKEGERGFVFCRNHGADTALKAEEVDKSLIKNAGTFHFGSLSLALSPIKEACYEALRYAKSKGLTISFDVNYRSMLWKDESSFLKEISYVLPNVNILKVSEDEALLITHTESIEDALNLLTDVPIVLVTKGKNGAVCSVHGERAEVPGYKATAIDTTGAGDIFLGVFLSQMISSGESANSIKIDKVNAYCDKACYYAAKSTEKHGAIPSIPNFYV